MVGILVADTVDAANTRAWSVLTVTKAVDDGDSRLIHGIATTPSTDRVGDIVEPLGAEFQLPIPLLWQHDARQPIGHVIDAKITKAGIAIVARLAKADEPGALRDRLDDAWQSIKIGLVRGLSIGFKALEVSEIQGTFGIRFLKWLWLELSTVTIPANGDASITAIKSADAAHLVASDNGRRRKSPGVTGLRRDATMTAQERVQGLEAKRGEAFARMTAAQAKADAEGRSKDETERDQFETAQTELETIDKELADARTLERLQLARATPPAGIPGAQPMAAAPAATIQVRDVELPLGIPFARAIMCRMSARLNMMSGDGSFNPVDIARERYPNHAALHRFLQGKAAVPAGTTTETTYAAPLAYQDNFAAGFVEFLRPATIVGKFGQNGIPGLTRTPFNVRVPKQTSGGNAYWVGEGAPKPLTSVAFSSVSLTHDKVATIAVLTKELIRLSSPSAEERVRDTLRDAVVERIDRDFIDPAHAAVSNVSPASITNGVSALPTAGTSIDNVITDVGNLFQAYIEANMDASGLVLIMPNTLAMILGLMRNALGQRSFPDINVNGGNLLGLPVITSQHAANQSGGGNLVIAVHAPSILLADDGNVSVEASDQVSLQMLDNPTNNAATGVPTSMVSMFQTNSVAIKAEREITWAKARSEAVVYMDDVNWGSIGSPS